MVQEEASRILLVGTGMFSQSTACTLGLPFAFADMSDCIADTKASFTQGLHMGWGFIQQQMVRRTVGNGCMAESMGEYCNGYDCGT